MISTSDGPVAGRTGGRLADVWSLLGDDTEIGIDRCAIEPPTASVASGFRVSDIAGATVAAASLAAVDAGVARGGTRPGPSFGLTVETDHALADWRGRVLVDGVAPAAWASLSGWYHTADHRFVQLHCNFAHHATGVAARLSVPQERAAFEQAIESWGAFELEEALRNDGMICAAYRTLDEWAQHPHATATDRLPLITVDRIGDAAPRPAAPPRGAAAVAADPVEDALAGLRVLDCSRVLAGPVCGRTLAAHGADVLRVGAAHLPSIEGAVLATGFGKRNTDVDLNTESGRATFTDLLADADVFVNAYRPGALAARGFSAERAAELHPGIVVIEICAFDWIGPWGGRRGYDSIVQSTTGIALDQAAVLDVDEPVHLPVQALDFATGYLAAFAASRLLAIQARDGGSWRARLSLLRTRNWLVGLGGPDTFEAGPPPATERFETDVQSPFGQLRVVGPVVGRWRLPPSALGTSRPRWTEG